MGEILLKKNHEGNYLLLFDKNSGVSVRVGIDGKDPFWNPKGPELLDISITNYCEKGCSFCYRGSHIAGVHMSIEEYECIIRQAARVGVVQVALGGGNPNQHPQFIDILKLTRKYGIIPSYTTNGLGMTREIYEASKKYCGAIAVSWYEPHNVAKEVVAICKTQNIKCNIHFMLNMETIREAIRLLTEEQELLRNVNAVIFLNYKPIHSSADLCLIDGSDFKEFMKLALQNKACKIGFDSCMISFLMEYRNLIDYRGIDFCEAGRFSAFVSEDLILYPCSFMNDTNVRGVDLRKCSLQKGWKEGDLFIKIRERLAKPINSKNVKCEVCQLYESCHSGCAMFDINRCS